MLTFWSLALRWETYKSQAGAQYDISLAIMFYMCVNELFVPLHLQTCMPQITPWGEFSKLNAMFFLALTSRYRHFFSLTLEVMLMHLNAAGSLKRTVS